MESQSSSIAFMHEGVRELINVRPKIAIQPLQKIHRMRKLPRRENSQSGKSPLETAPKSPRTRTSSRKSRAGCLTCKRRHAKCDEIRPACGRCRHLGWACDYTPRDPTGFKTSLVVPQIGTQRGPGCTSPLDRPSPPLFKSENHPEGVYLQYAWDAFSCSPAYPFEVPLWSTLLQLSHSEPCIRHIVLGSAMIHQVYNTIVANPSNPSQMKIYRSGFQHYTKAVKGLKERLSNIEGKADRTTWEISLLASWLFTVFEVLVGNEEGAYWHMQGGFKLMKSVLSEHKTRANLPGNLEDIRMAFNRLDIQASTFSLAYDTNSLLPPTIPTKFYNMTDAKCALEALIPNILSVIRSQGLESCRQPSDSLPEALATKITSLKTTLQHWLHTFQTLLATLKFSPQELPVPFNPAHLKLTVAHHTLMIQYWTAFIWLGTPSSHCQTVHDPYLPAFITITDLAEAVIAIQPERKDYYTSDTAFIHPLFYVAQKCRDGPTRRRAVQILKNAGREGVWDGACTAAACEWIIGKEEEGLREGVIGSVERESEGWVEERWRLRGANISVNRLGKRLRITCLRGRLDGVDEMVEGFVGWGEEVKSVVYGEVDRVWQNGVLFG